MPTSDDFTSCVCVYPGGRARRASIKRDNLMNTARAKEALQADRAAYVAPQDESEIVAYAKGVRDVAGA